MSTNTAFREESSALIVQVKVTPARVAQIRSGISRLEHETNLWRLGRGVSQAIEARSDSGVRARPAAAPYINFWGWANESILRPLGWAFGCELLDVSSFLPLIDQQLNCANDGLTIFHLYERNIDY
jgi:hypothetical protein